MNQPLQSCTGIVRNSELDLGRFISGIDEVERILGKNYVLGRVGESRPLRATEGHQPEDSSFFTSIGHPFPAVCIRTSTERPEALDKGCFVLSGIDTIGLLQSVDVAVSLIRDGLPGIPVPDYVDENVSTKVVRIIQSYVGVVNKMVWRKF